MLASPFDMHAFLVALLDISCHSRTHTLAIATSVTPTTVPQTILVVGLNRHLQADQDKDYVTMNDVTISGIHTCPCFTNNINKRGLN